MNALDGEQFAGADEAFAEDLEQQQLYGQGKYNMSFYPKHC
jgi:hypothetical protein